MVQFPWKLVRQVLQKSNIELPFDPSILLHTTYPRELKHVTTQKLTHECLCCRWNPQSRNNPIVYQLMNRQVKCAAST